MRKAVLVLILGVTGLGAWMGLNMWQAWQALERIPFDTAGARSILPFAESAPLPDDATTILIVGIDERPEQDYTRADALHLLTLDRTTPSLVSFPRDLLVVDPCTGAESTLGRQYDPCGASASERLAVAIEDLAGVPIDVYVEFGFGEYAALIDELGGFEVCVDNPVRRGPDQREGLTAGCHLVDGETALWWARHRTPQEFVEGEWRPAADIGDLARVERIQSVLLSVFDELRAVHPWSPGADEISRLVSVSSMSLSDGVRLARTLTALKPEELQVSRRAGTPVVTASGMYALDPG